MRVRVDDLSRTHYEILGVDHTATLDEIRAAHRHLARMLHPDHHLADGEGERQLAERRMREVNEAWTVLSNESHRSEYDQLIRLTRGDDDYRISPDGDSRATGHINFDQPHYDTPVGTHGSFVDENGHRVDAVFFDSDEEEDAQINPLGRFLRPVPVVAVLLIAFAIFVFTAYAGSDSNEPVTGGDKAKTAKECVLNQGDGQTVIAVPCSGPSDGRIVDEVEKPLDCPVGTTYAMLDAKVVCVEPQVSVMSETTVKD